MTKFKVGDKFIPRMTKTNAAEWNRYMKLYDGETLIVEQITPDGYIRPKDFGVCLFHPDWCEKVEDEVVNFVQREGDVIAIEATLSTNATLAECSKPFIIATSNQYEGIKSEEGTAKAPYEPYIPLSTKHIPEVRKMVDSSEIPNNQEHIVEANKMIDWEQRRYELAKDFMAAIITGLITTKADWVDVGEVGSAIDLADEMIKQLKGE